MFNLWLLSLHWLGGIIIKYQGSKRLQAGLGTEIKRKVDDGHSANGVILARVLKVNYLKNTIDYVDTHTGSRHVDKHGAMLPVNFGGRNGYGNSYGQVYPIRVNDLVLIAYANNDKKYPLVISRYVDEKISKELSPSEARNSMISTPKNYAPANQVTTIYPDQTVTIHRGTGSIFKTFPGDTLLSVVNGNGGFGAETSDTPFGKMSIKNISHFTYKANEIPLNRYAPRIVFQHAGEYVPFSDDTEKDHHVFSATVTEKGLLRLVAKRDNEDWVSTFTMNSGTDKKAGTLRLRRQNKNEDWNDTHAEHGEFFIDHKNTVMLKRQKKKTGDVSQAEYGELFIDDKNTVKLRRQNENGKTTDYGELFIDHKNTLYLTSGNTQLEIIKGHHMYAQDVKGTDRIDLYQKALYTRSHLRVIDRILGLQSDNDSDSSSQVSSTTDQNNTNPQDIQQLNTITNTVYGSDDPDTAATSSSSASSADTASAIEDTDMNRMGDDDDSDSSDEDLNRNGSSDTTTTTIKSGNTANNLNFFAQSTTIANTTIDTTTGNTVNRVGSESTPQIAAVRNFEYTLTAYNVKKSTNIVLAFYDLFKNFISDTTGNGNSGNVSATMKAPNNAYYIKASIDNLSVNVKLEQSATPTNWTPNYIDLTSVKAVKDNVLSRAQANANNAKNWQNIINSGSDQNYLLSLVQKDGKVLVDDTNTLQLKWQNLQNMVNSMVARAGAYPIDTTAVTNASKTFKTSVAFLAGNDSETSVDNYQTNVNNLFSALKTLANALVTATTTSINTLENIPSFNASGATNYLLGTGTPVVINSSNLDANNQAVIYKMSGQATNMTGPIEFYCTVQGQTLDATVNIIELLSGNEGSTQTVQLANNVDISSGMIDQNVSPIVPNSNQSASIALQIVGYEEPLTISSAILCNQTDGTIVWGPAPEDVASVAESKMASLTVAPDQITSSVFDTLLQESSIFNQTADKVDVAVTKGELSTGFTADGKSGVLTLFGKQINIVGEFIDNSTINKLTLQDAKLNSSSSTFTLDDKGKATDMDLESPTLNMAIINNANFTNSGFSLDPSDTNKGNKITSRQANMTIDNNGINFVSDQANMEINNTGINFTKGTTINNNAINTTNFTSGTINTSTIDSQNNLKLSNTGITITPLLNNQNYTSQESSVTVDGNGNFLQTVSANTYVNNVNTISDTIDKGKALLNVAPKSWNDKNDSSNKNQVGILADDLVSAGLSDYVTYDGSGNPMGVQYGKLVTLLLPLIQQLVKKAGI